MIELYINSSGFSSDLATVVNLLKLQAPCFLIRYGRDSTDATDVCHTSEIRACPARVTNLPHPRPCRNPRLPTPVLKAKILHQSVGIRFVPREPHFCLENHISAAANLF